MRSIVISDLNFDFVASQAIMQVNPTPMKYDEDYFENYRQRSQSAIADQLAVFRKNYVETLTSGLILDYGTGYGVLVESDTTGRWRGFDIMPQTKLKLGAKFDDNALENLSAYGAVCFFDSIEHLPTLDILNQIASGAHCVISMPMWENWNNLQDIVSWRHWKPHEHLLYASKDGMIELMSKYGFSLVNVSNRETELGRLDIATFCFHKSNGK